MADNKYSCGIPNVSPRDTAAVESNRIYDSCRDRDCFENVRVFLNGYGHEIIQRTGTVRVKCAEVAWTYIGLDNVQFSRGFYTVNIRFFVRLTFEGCIGVGRPQEFSGIAVLEKRVVLYGGESNVSVFRSEPGGDSFCSAPDLCECERNLPVAVVEVVPPVVLGTRICEVPTECKCCCCACDIPEKIYQNFEGGPLLDEGDRYLTVSLGIFSVVRMVRPAQYLINACEYAVPDKECCAPEEDDPCCVFNNMAFPIAEFTPSACPTRRDRDTKCGCKLN